uniref:Uncharacterized protein n=1 Tax=Anguilla anguilla TaxID=7936 RepID=A0A0E9QNK9_ANGAN
MCTSFKIYVRTNVTKHMQKCSRCSLPRCLKSPHFMLGFYCYSKKCISEKGTKLKYILGDFCFLKPEEFCTILYTFVNSYNYMYFVQILVVNP